MTRRRLRLGMVGGGQGAFIGAVHRIASRIDDRYELVAGALSSEPKRALASAEELGLDPARSYESYEQMANAESERDDGIDVVSIVTPNHVHADPVAVFAAKGIHVICDKPLADSTANAKKAQAALADSGVEFLLTHNYSGYPLIRHARAMIAAGELGEIRTVRAAYLQDWLATDMENQGLKQAEWRTDPARSGQAGSLGDIGTHAFQLLKYVTDLELESVAANVTANIPGRKVDDHADIMLRYAGGVHGSLTCSQISVGHENDLTIAIYGSKASIRWAQESPNEMIVTEHGKPPRVLTRASGELGEWAAAATRVPAGHPEGYLEAFAQIYLDFAERIHARLESKEMPTGAPLPGIDDGMAGMQFIDAALKSAQSSGGWVNTSMP